VAFINEYAEFEVDVENVILEVLQESAILRCDSLVLEI